MSDYKLLAQIGVCHHGYNIMPPQPMPSVLGCSEKKSNIRNPCLKIIARFGRGVTASAIRTRESPPRENGRNTTHLEFVLPRPTTLYANTTLRLVLINGLSRRRKKYDIESDCCIVIITGQENVVRSSCSFDSLVVFVVFGITANVPNKYGPNPHAGLVMGCGDR